MPKEKFVFDGDKNEFVECSDGAFSREEIERLAEWDLKHIIAAHSFVRKQLPEPITAACGYGPGNSRGIPA